MLNSDNGKRYGKDGRYPTRKLCSFGEWWKNYILPQHAKEWANVAFFDEPLNLFKALRSKDASLWESAIQEKCDSLMAKGI